MKLKALKRISYAGKPYKAGDVFDAKPADVRILLAVKHAEVWVEPVYRKPVTKSIVNRSMDADVPYVFSPPTAPEVEAEPAQPDEVKKRSYKRRDMTAE